MSYRKLYARTISGINPLCAYAMTAGGGDREQGIVPASSKTSTNLRDRKRRKGKARN